MQELEKILEEMQEVKEIMLSPQNIDCFGEPCKENDCCACVINKCMEIVKKHMNDGWIPVEERLPEYGKKVLAYGKSGKIDIASLYSRDKHMWLVGSMCSVAFDIVAWRTLPEPYRSERRDNHDGE